MATAGEREVYRTLRDSQDKYAYFLLTGAGAAIAFATTQTQGAAMRWTQAPLALAVVAWASSFYFGCRYIAYVNSTMSANAAMLRIQTGEDPEIGTHLGIIAAATAGIRKAMEDNSNRANWLCQMQFKALVIGGALYITWHVLEMYLRTKP